MNRSRQDSSVIRWTGVVMMCLVAGVPNAFSKDSERPDDVLEAQEVIVTATKVPTPMSHLRACRPGGCGDYTTPRAHRLDPSGHRGAARCASALRAQQSPADYGGAGQLYP